MEKGLYQHYKGSYYEVIALAKHSETLEMMVVYHKQNQPEDCWVRPLSMFQETIQVNGKTLHRFKKIK